MKRIKNLESVEGPTGKPVRITQADGESKIACLRDIVMMALENFHNFNQGQTTLQDLENGRDAIKKVREWTYIIELEKAEYTWIFEKVELVLPKVWGVHGLAAVDAFRNVLSEDENPNGEVSVDMNAPLVSRK